MRRRLPHSSEEALNEVEALQAQIDSLTAQADTNKADSDSLKTQLEEKQAQIDALAAEQGGIGSASIDSAVQKPARTAATDTAGEAGEMAQHIRELGQALADNIEPKSRNSTRSWPPERKLALPRRAIWPRSGKPCSASKRL